MPINLQERIRQPSNINTIGIMKTNTKITALVSTILLSVALAGPANATTPEPVRDAPTISVQPESSKISAMSSASIKYEKPEVQTVAAPKPVAAPEPVVTSDPVPVEVQPQSAPVQAGIAPTGKVSTVVEVKAPAQRSAPTSKVSASGKGASIAAAAYAQLGVAQDCTMLATNSLAAVGINYHGWPAGYLSLGRTVSAAEAQPGDLAYYANGGTGLAHIAVYVGGGMAVHGGWNGGTTSLQSVNVGSGPVFIRVA